MEESHGSTVGVVGARAADVAPRVAEAGASVETGASGAVLASSVDAVVATGEPALTDLVRTASGNVSVPVLPVEAGGGVGSVPLAAVEDAVRAFLAAGWETRTRPILGVTVGGTVHRGLYDAMLVTAEPSRISEFSLESVDGAGDPLDVARFRADGVVVATGTGSVGYATDAGGPLVGPGVDAAVAVPIAQFDIASRRWVVDYPVTLTVERDEGDVSLLVDGVDAGVVDAGHPVRVEPVATLTLAHVAAGRHHFRVGSEESD